MTQAGSARWSKARARGRGADTRQNLIAEIVTIWIETGLGSSTLGSQQLCK